MKTVFFCNHQVALFALQDLASRDMLAGIVTSDFGHDFATEVGLFAKSQDLPYIQSGQYQLEHSLVDWLKEISPDVIMVMTFPYRLPKVVLDLAPHGCWNFHLGLLPGYRGPDPVFWQIRNGESYGGLTVHRMVEHFDAGPIVFERKMPIADSDILGNHLSGVAQFAPEGVQTLCKFLDQGVGELCDQDESKACYRSRPTKDELMIDWDTMGSQEIVRLVRAANPSYQGAQTILRVATVCLHEVEAIPLSDPPDEEPGTIVEAPGDPNLYVLCKDSACLRVNVASVPDGVCSGTRLREIFKLKSGEKFGSEPMIG